MIRNKELRLHLLSLLGLTIIAVIVTTMMHPLSGLVVAVFSVCMMACTMLFTQSRYKELEKLAGYLRKISNGNDQLDIRDNREGELSILKNEIYKVTMMLSKQGESLREDKIHLADALSDISHQLKTPLTSITVMTDLLTQSDLSKDKRKEFTQNIAKQLKRMDWLLNSLLTLSKIDAGTLEFKMAPIQVNELVEEALKTVLIIMDIKDQKLSVSVKESVEARGDFNWLREALINILKNCIEHTPVSGELYINADDNPIYTEIIIRDTGSGIDKEDLPYIFNRFYKGRNAGKDSIGIGLAMAKSIIESQNGTIIVESEREIGTVFIIKLYKNQSD